MRFLRKRRDHKERREVADLRLICRFFVFTNPRMCYLWLNVCYIWNCPSPGGQVDFDSHMHYNGGLGGEPVSYTHLTLPTSDLV